MDFCCILKKMLVRVWSTEAERIDPSMRHVCCDALFRNIYISVNFTYKEGQNE